MNYWNKIPLFRIMIPFLLGIIIAFHLQLSNSYLYIFIVVAVICFLCISYFKRYFSSYSKRWIFGVLINLFFLVFGVLITQQHKPINIRFHFKNYSANASVVILKEDIVAKTKSYKCEVEVIAIKSGDNWRKTQGKAILYLAKDTLAELLTYGDTLFVNGKWKVIENPSNPAQFNYKNFLLNSNITAQQYLQGINWKLISFSDNNSFRKLAFVYQKKLLSHLEIYFQNEELAVISALLLGYKDLLDRETIMIYSSSGAMHVLAVSGLHVGIIYLLLNSLFLFFEKFKYGKYLKAVLLILSLWAYALLTGLSPSVLRATTMFSFIIIGSALNRETNIYNTLAASAFVLLLYNPYILLQVGFQLSYAAVLGIVYLQPKLYKLMYTKYWLLDKIWAITTVSIAAQLATFPLGMYYFHQFPNYFLLSNLFVIPLATFIIGGGVLLFVISAIPFLSGFLAFVVNMILVMLNFSVQWVENLPYSLSLGISITVMETIIIYSIIILFFSSIIKRKARLFQMSFTLAILFMTLQIEEQYRTGKQQYFIVYDAPKERAIDFVDGNQNYFIADENLNKDKSKMRFHIMHYRWERRVKQSTLFPDFFSKQNYFRNGNYIQFFDKSILLLDTEFKKPTNISDLQFDYIVISNKAKLDLENITCNQVIIDSSVPNYRWEQIKKECLKLDIPFYNVNTQGAFLFEFTSA